jgi:hypothetical protein
VAAPLLGGYGPAARGSAPSAAAAAAAKCWAVGVPLGLVLRGLSRGYVPPGPFIVVSMVTTAVLLVGWRSALAATSKKVRVGGCARVTAVHAGVGESGLRVRWRGLDVVQFCEYCSHGGRMLRESTACRQGVGAGQHHGSVCPQAGFRS